MKNITFINGKCVLKAGKKILAKVYDRKEFFKGLNVSYDLKYPYSIEISAGIRECETLEECLFYLNKYL